MCNYRKICEGVFKCEYETGSQTVELEGNELHRIMDFFFINVPADELSPEQVSALCQARAEDLRCFGGANQIIKSLFTSFLAGQQATNILEVGAGSNPILSASEIARLNVNYIASDADSNYQRVVVRFGDESDLQYPNDHFDIVIALFVLHFKFYIHQISQVYQHLKSDGIFLANVYNRSGESREQLKRDFENGGFVVEMVEDPKKHCKNHYYLIAAKNPNSVEINKVKLMNLINNT